jgi:hypothetical protein
VSAIPPGVLIVCAVMLTVYGFWDTIVAFLGWDDGPLTIEYENEINSNRFDGLSRTSAAMLPKEGGLKPKTMTHHRFYVGVKNVSKKTVRDAKIAIVYLTPPMSVSDALLPSKSSGIATVDIPPDHTEWFLFLSGYDQNSVGYHRLAFICNNEYENLHSAVESLPEVGGWIHSHHGGPIPILKNDNYVLEIKVMGDDVKPDLGLIRVMARNMLEVYVFRFAVLPRSRRRRLLDPKILFDRTPFITPRVEQTGIRSPLGIGRKTRR